MRLQIIFEYLKTLFKLTRPVGRRRKRKPGC